MTFNPLIAGEAAKAERVLRKGRNYKKRRSILEPFRNEIVQLYDNGYSLELIAVHIHKNHGINVVPSTIHRYLKSIKVTRV